MSVALNMLDELIEKAYETIGAKLSTKKRKSLKKQSFCGPNRSFPCNDCAHYTSALRLLNRSKFSAEAKKRIKRCIINKGIKLGCKGAKEKKGEKSSYLTLDIQKLYNSEEFATTKKLVEESIKNPGMDLDCGCE